MTMKAETQEHERETPPEETPAATPGASDATPRTPDEEAKGAAATEAFARGHDGLTDGDEQDALDYLLAPKVPRLYDVTVDYDTKAGIRPMKFVLSPMDGRRIENISQSHVNETTGKMDVISADLQLVVEATKWIEGRPGHKMELSSEEFRTVMQPDGKGGFEPVVLASPIEALEARFKTQLGLISAVSAQINRISGYGGARVGDAQRRLTDAVGNS